MNRIRDYWKRIKLFRVVSFNSGVAILRLVISLITNKFISIMLGPAGMAVTAQMQNFIQGIQGISTLGISEAITRYTSLYRNRDKRLRLFLLRSGRLVLYVAILIGVFLFLLAPQVSHYLFVTHYYAFLIRVLALLAPAYAYQMLLTAILNGLEEYKKIATVNVVIHLTGLVLMLAFIGMWMLTGAVAAVILTPAVGFAVAIMMLNKEDRNLLFAPLQLQQEKFNGFVRRVIPYIGMALTAAVLHPFFTILIRNQIIGFYGPRGLQSAGYWDAARKVSAFYFMFITPVFSMYYFPRISRLHKAGEWMKEIGEMLRHFFPWIGAGMAVVWIFRRLLTRWVFSVDFVPVNPLYIWQIAGDILGLLALLLAYRMWARAMTFRFFASELFYWLLYYFLVKTFLPVHGIVGVMEAFVWSKAGYLVLMLIYFRKDLAEALIRPRTDGQNDA